MFPEFFARAVKQRTRFFCAAIGGLKLIVREISVKADHGLTVRSYCLVVIL
jgi:hypothetical protein